MKCGVLQLLKARVGMSNGWNAVQNRKLSRHKATKQVAMDLERYVLDDAKLVVAQSPAGQWHHMDHAYAVCRSGLGYRAWWTNFKDAGHGSHASSCPRW